MNYFYEQIKWLDNKLKNLMAQHVKQCVVRSPGHQWILKTMSDLQFLVKPANPDELSSCAVLLMCLCLGLKSFYLVSDNHC